VAAVLLVLAGTTQATADEGTTPGTAPESTVTAGPDEGSPSTAPRSGDSAGGTPEDDDPEGTAEDDASAGSVEPSPTAEETPDTPPADETSAASTWSAATPTVFGLGDSLFMQCRESLGVGTRSLGIIGWGHGTSQDMRERLSSAVADWPYMTEPSHAEELTNFRTASTLVIGLGTNDVAGRVSAAQYRSNVDWFMEQAAGRPVLWFNLYHPAYQANVAAFNAILADAAQRWPNLRILDWHGYVAAHPEVVHRDRIHLASYAACRQGRFALIQENIPPVTGHADSPDWIDPAPAPPPSPNPVTVEYERTGGARGPLGAAAGAVSCGRAGDGCVQYFAGGAITWSPRTGTRTIPSSAAQAWRAEFEETGRVGYPIGAAVCGLRSGGCRQEFERGFMYWSTMTAPRDVMRGPLLSRYLAVGAQNTSLGYPTTNVTCGLGGTACMQNFQGGTLFWSSTTGTAFGVNGHVRNRWLALGGHNGALGLPTMDTRCGLRNGGCGQHFTRGTLYWSSSTGARTLVGAIRDRHLAIGGDRSVLGYPTMDTRCGLKNGGCGQHFEGGTVYWSPSTGARIVGLSIRTRYLASGAEKSGLGYPTMDTTCALRGGGCGQHFQGGSLFAVSRTASARVVFGAIRDRWLALGGVSSRYGYPLADPVAVPGGYTQRFQRGTLTYRYGRWY
jgi:uncharacterized protein with LGFP repeats